MPPLAHLIAIHGLERTGMASAVQTRETTRTANPRLKLAMASLFAAFYVIAGIAVALVLLPQYWEKFVAPSLVEQLNPFANALLRALAQIAAVGIIVTIGSLLAGDSPPKGLRGGIFLVISIVIAVFFIVRAVGLNTSGSQYGMSITAATLGILAFFAGRFMLSERGANWMIGLEELGLFHTFQYKRLQGIRVRRLTLIGILLIGFTGIYALISRGTLGTGNWRLEIPFTGVPNQFITILPDIQFTMPILLAAFTLWLGWRLINIPTFADFLIATEAEMNKVSWSSRKRLFQDTIVVLATVILMTLFLLVVDLFWGWLLSRKYIAVLPPSSEQTAPVDPSQGGTDW